MARPRLPDTGDGPRTISVRWSEAHHLEYLSLGGSKWLRRVVQDEINKKAAAKENASEDDKSE